MQTCHDSEDQSKCKIERSEKQFCNTFPCFNLGGWSQWSACSGKCGGGLTKRSRSCTPNIPATHPEYSIAVLAMNGLAKWGTNATVRNYIGEHMSDCLIHSVYESKGCNSQPCSGQTNYAYSTSMAIRCNKVCGGGRLRLSRRCLANGDWEVPSYKCDRYATPRPFRPPHEELRCNTRPCVLSEWGSWGGCNRACGEGVQYTSRTCSEFEDQSFCRFGQSRTRRCNAGPCFWQSDWTKWTSCTKSCGGGLTSRTRLCRPTIAASRPTYRYLTAIMKSSGPDPSNLEEISRSHIDLFSRGVPISYHYQFLVDCKHPLSESKPCNTEACLPSSNVEDLNEEEEEPGDVGSGLGTTIVTSVPENGINREETSGLVEESSAEVAGSSGSGDGNTGDGDAPDPWSK